MTIRRTAGLSGMIVTICAFCRLDAQTLVAGTIKDSLSGGVLAGATVQVVPTAAPWSAGWTVTSDASGRFVFSNLPAGRYTTGFLHPRLDSLGFDAVTSTLEVPPGRATLTANLSLPSAATLRATLCGPRIDGTGVVIGRVRSAESGALASGMAIAAEWVEVRFGTAGIARQLQRATVPVATDGRYVLCGVPTDVTLQLQAVSHDSSASASSGAVDADFPYGAMLLHRDLLVSTPGGASQTATASAVGAPVDTAAGLRRPRRGLARLTGVVVGGDGAPIRGARVTVPDADLTTTSTDDGTFRLAQLPGGTFSVDVIALGYVPLRTAADLLPERDVSLRVTMRTAVTTLESVTVSDVASLDRVGFAARRRKGTGYFVTADEARRRGALSVPAALAMAPGLRMAQGGSEMLGRGRCVPRVYVNGVFYDVEVKEQSLNSVDNIVPFAQIGGIEVYVNPADAPAQYSALGSHAGREANAPAPFSSPGAPAGRVGDSGCAVIVIWSKDFVR